MPFLSGVIIDLSKILVSEIKESYIFSLSAFPLPVANFLISDGVKIVRGMLC
jgi:hypothetical protein